MVMDNVDEFLGDELSSEIQDAPQVQISDFDQ